MKTAHLCHSHVMYKETLKTNTCVAKTTLKLIITAIRGVIFVQGFQFGVPGYEALFLAMDAAEQNPPSVSEKAQSMLD